MKRTGNLRLKLLTILMAGAIVMVTFATYQVLYGS